MPGTPLLERLDWVALIPYRTKEERGGAFRANNGTGNAASTTAPGGGGGGGRDSVGAN